MKFVLYNVVTPNNNFKESYHRKQSLLDIINKKISISQYMILVITIIIFFSTKPICNSQDIISNLYQQGILHYSNQNWLAAIDYLGQVCDMNPDHHDARYYLAYSLIMVKKYNEALMHANILVSKNPNHKQYLDLKEQITKIISQAAVQKSNIFTKYGSNINSNKTNIPSSTTYTSSGKIKIRKEVEITSNSEDITISQNNKTKKQTLGKPPKSTSKLEEVLDLLDNKEYIKAINLLDELLKKEPKNPKYLHYRGIIEIEQNNYDKAIPWLKKATEQDKNNFESWFLLGETYLKLNNLKEAENAFEKALAIKQDPFAYINLGNVYRYQNKLSKAIEIYEKACKLDSNILEAQLNLADTLVDFGKLNEASEKINEILTSNPTNAHARFIKGKILYYSDMFEDAVSEIKISTTAEPSNTYYKLFLAKVLLKMQRTGEVIEIVSYILSDAQFGLEAKLLMAEALILEGQLSDAEEHLNEVEKKANFPQVFRLKGILAQKKNDFDTAKAMFQKYISKDPNNGYAYLEYATLLETSGDTSAAIEVYKTILNHFPNTSISQKVEDKLSNLKTPQSSSSASTSNSNPANTPSLSTHGDY